MEVLLRDMAPTDGRRRQTRPDMLGAQARRSRPLKALDHLDHWEVFVSPQRGSAVIEGRVLDGAVIGRNPTTEELWFAGGAPADWAATAECGGGFAIYEHEFSPRPEA